MASVRFSFPHFLPESESAAAVAVAIGALKQKLDKSKYKRDLDVEKTSLERVENKLPEA